MEEKYIRFYMSFHKAFQGKKSNSLFCSGQSRWSNRRGCSFRVHSRDSIEQPHLPQTLYQETTTHI